MTPFTLLKMLIVLREDLCDGDVNSHRRAQFTVEEIEYYSKKIDAFYTGE